MTAGAEPEWTAAIVIPARNEELLLPRCLEAVEAARVRVGTHCRVRCVVVADACHDRTEEVAAETLGSDDILISGDWRSVGGARRAGVAAALLAEGRAGRDRLWIANTDADTCVPPDWLEVHLGLADEGWSGIAGIVRVDDFGPRRRTERRFRDVYRTRRNGTHSHVHGANLGVRADAYTDVGGWPPLHTGEDHALWGMLKTAGWRTTSTIGSCVVTSGRETGRAPDGFARRLRLL